MFYLSYLRRELTRRLGRTLITVVGLAVGVGSVVAISSVSRGLDQAQKEVLGPLAGIGTDVLVTRPAGLGAAAPAPAEPGAAPAPSAGRASSFQLSPEESQQLAAETQSITTDLSKLGKAGDSFVHDYFLPATALTFSADQLNAVRRVEGVEAVTAALVLQGVHQEGKVPEIVAEFQTGGERIEVNQEVPAPSREEREKIEACMAAERAKGSSPGDAFQTCLPERFRRFRSTITTPLRTIRQVLNPPQTDIKSDPYTVAGVNPANPDLGIITPSQITQGRFFLRTSSKEVLLSESYAQRKDLKLGGTLTMNGTEFKIVGLAKPPLGGTNADVYMPLQDLQVLSTREGRVSALVVRVDDAANVKAASKRIEAAFPGAQVSTAEDVAEQVSGSLIEVSDLVGRVGFLLSVIAVTAAFLVAILVTLSSLAKRIREIGTLKAIGWRNGRVVRQILGESVVVGVLGGLVGLALGIGAALAIAAWAPPLEATAVSSPGIVGLIFGPGAQQSSGTTVELAAAIGPAVVLIGLGVALLGGLIAGGLGAFRASRLRPAESLRTVG